MLLIYRFSFLVFVLYDGGLLLILTINIILKKSKVKHLRKSNLVSRANRFVFLMISNFFFFFLWKGKCERIFDATNGALRTRKRKPVLFLISFKTCSFLSPSRETYRRHSCVRQNIFAFALHDVRLNSHVHNHTELS